MIKVAIIGAGGYVGGELARLLARHPHTELVCAATRTYAGKPLKTVFAGLSGSPVGELICEDGGVDAPGVANAEIVFLAQDNGVSMHTAPKLLAQGKRVIDMAADFRLTNLDVFREFYRMEHAAPNLLLSFDRVYGLPERYRDAIRDARLVANPGCHVTAAVLALAPLLQAGVIENHGIIIDSKTGLSGAGRAKNDLAFKFSEANESAVAYGIGGTHRHTPEIEQVLSHAADRQLRVSFTPHLVPMTRGILSTCYARPVGTPTTQSILTILRDVYAKEPFVVVREAGDQPRTKDVWGSNFCHLCAAMDERTGTVIVTSAIDNLVKGAAGQAVQNLNIMCGFPETAGLEGAGICP
ncbi:MAG: N-acetyl-gamma-glutamyl-phosphate reductase [Armatimonadetes bacterium]|nr:N-acetyl-gamma-glutamyl-phosphate reductase [Armatimonadota bacterium]